MSTVDNLQQNIDLYNSWLVAWHSGRTSNEGVRNSTQLDVELSCVAINRPLEVS